MGLTFEYTPVEDIDYFPGVVELGQACAEAVNALMGVELMILGDIHNYIEVEGEDVNPSKLQHLAELKIESLKDTVHSIVNNAFEAMLKVENEPLMHMTMILTGFAHDLMADLAEASHEDRELEIPPQAVMNVQVKILNVISMLAMRYCNHYKILPGKLKGKLAEEMAEMEFLEQVEKDFSEDNLYGKDKGEGEDNGERSSGLY